MSSNADIISDGTKTVIANDRGGCHGHHTHSRESGCDGIFHLLSGQRALEKAIGDVGERAADRAILFVKAMGDSEARTAALLNTGFTTVLKDANDNVTRVIKEINDNEKALDAKLFALQAKMCESEKETIKTNFENTIRVLEKVGEICGPRLFRECGDRHGVVISK